jgi:hypothetical protein
MDLQNIMFRAFLSRFLPPSRDAAVSIGEDDCVVAGRGARLHNEAVGGGDDKQLSHLGSHWIA